MVAARRRSIGILRQLTGVGGRQSRLRLIMDYREPSRRAPIVQSRASAMLARALIEESQRRTEELSRIIENSRALLHQSQANGEARSPSSRSAKVRRE